MRVIDLSFPIGPHFRWTVASERRSTHEAGQNFQSTGLTVSCHAYTHVDAPVHFLPGDRDIASMPVDQWMGEAAVVDPSRDIAMYLEEAEAHGLEILGPAKKRD